MSLFCYENAAIARLVESLARLPTLMLLTPGPAQTQVTSGLGALRIARLPWLTQDDFDRLLWSCDLNFVRGEDSLVRAVWAGQPFVWQAYPQADQAHHAKVQALISRLELPADATAIWRAWNGLAPWPHEGAPQEWPALPPWQRAVWRSRAALLHQRELVMQLRDFVASTRRP